jgi:hypothetical protein
MGSTFGMMRWMLPVDESGGRRRSIRLLDPGFQLPFDQVHYVSNIYRWIARTACPDFPELAEILPDYFDDWEQILKKIGGEVPYTNVALIELKGGFLGLGPITVTEQDALCIMPGCYRPVILRKEGEHNTLIGTCFVLGLMKWEEVASVIRKDKLDKERFNIR